MSLPYDHPVIDYAVPLPIPVVRSQYSHLENWPHSLPDINDGVIQSFSQLLALNTFQSIGTSSEDRSGETCASTPDRSSYWTTASLSETFATPVIPSNDAIRRSSLPLNHFPRESIRTVEEARRIKRRAQNRAAQHAFKARKRQQEQELCEKIKQVQEANAELRSQNAQLKTGLRQHVESKLTVATPTVGVKHRQESTSPQPNAGAGSTGAGGVEAGVQLETKATRVTIKAEK